MLKRNELCHCGSGEKYKRCCKPYEDQPVSRLLNGHPLQPQAPQMVLAQPLNDIQLVALLAVQLPHTLAASEAVGQAQDIVAEAVARQGDMERKILAAKQFAHKAALDARA